MFATVTMTHCMLQTVSVDASWHEVVCFASHSPVTAQAALLFHTVCSIQPCQEDTSLSKVHTLFRQLGLRHSLVIPRASCVVGVITRHDLLPEALEDTLLGQQAPLGAGRSARTWACC